MMFSSLQIFHIFHQSSFSLAADQTVQGSAHRKIIRASKKRIDETLHQLSRSTTIATMYPCPCRDKSKKEQFPFQQCTSPNRSPSSRQASQVQTTLPVSLVDEDRAHSIKGVMSATLPTTQTLAHANKIFEKRQCCTGLEFETETWI